MQNIILEIFIKIEIKMQNKIFEILIKIKKNENRN